MHNQINGNGTSLVRGLVRLADSEVDSFSFVALNLKAIGRSINHIVTSLINLELRKGLIDLEF